MKIYFGGKWWKVVGTATLPGGGIAYGINDEPNHIDWIVNPEKIKE